VAAYGALAQSFQPALPMTVTWQRAGSRLPKAWSLQGLMQPLWFYLMEDSGCLVGLDHPGVNFINFFWHNVYPYWHSLSQNIRQYADSSVNYAEKMFYEICHSILQGSMLQNFLGAYYNWISYSVWSLLTN